MQSEIEEESEALTDMRRRRASTIIREGLETAPLHGEESDTNADPATENEGFD